MCGFCLVENENKIKVNSSCINNNLIMLEFFMVNKCILFAFSWNS